MSNERREFKLLPKNTYNLKVTKAEIKESKKTDECFYLATEFTVANGEHQGMKVWDNYILAHPEAAEKPDGAGMAVSIGTKNVDSLLQAIGLDGIGDLNGEYNRIPKKVLDQEITAEVYVQTQSSKNPEYDGRKSNKARKFQRGF